MKADFQQDEQRTPSASEEPQTIGHVAEARFDPWDGIVAMLEIGHEPIDGVFVDLGLIKPRESIGLGLLRAFREGRGPFFRISIVPRAFGDELVAADGLTYDRIREISSITAVDIVLTPAATGAGLVRPLP